MNRWWQPVNTKRFEKRKCETEKEKCVYFHPPNIVGLCSSEEELACSCCRDMKKKNIKKEGEKMKQKDVEVITENTAEMYGRIRNLYWFSTGLLLSNIICLIALYVGG